MTDVSSNPDDVYAPLRGLRVGISGAVPERELWGDVPDLDQLILRFVSQLSGLILKYGGEVVHGSHPTFTPILTKQAALFGTERTKPLTLIASKLFGDPPQVVERAGDVAHVILTPRVGEGTAEEPATRNDSLTALRIELARQVDVVVAVGGKLHWSTGYHPGVLEELTHARWQSVPCFLVANLGGFTGQVDVEMVRQFSAGNHMDDVGAQAMALRSDEVDASVGRLLEHLVKHRDRFVRSAPGKIRDATRDFLVDSVTKAVPESLVESITTTRVRRASERFAAVRAAFEKGDAMAVGRLLSA